MRKYLELAEQHKNIMDQKNIIIWVYTNASGFLWGISKLDSGTDLGWSDFNGDCKMTGSFKTYESALEDAIILINKCDLDKFKEETPTKKFHWGNYSHHLNSNYR